MITRPTLHGPSATVGQLREFFRDDHVHAALLVDEGVLIGVVVRPDLEADIGDDTPARRIARLAGRTIDPEAAASKTLETMKRTDRRRLAVVNDTGRLLGLLCLKASRLGFCSDGDVHRRKCATD
ncbi:MAG TPA: CBS domain-containing protein [Gaiellaceae bacterium]|nr:CBS domain-containing protein [Gaiellaceae bacterium]